MLPPVTFIQNAPTCPPGRLGQALQTAEITTEVVHVYNHNNATPNTELWDPTKLVDAPIMVILGGPMGANDDDAAPWLPQLRQIIAARAATNAPTLGVCLGHQLMAVALGGTVEPNFTGPTNGLVDFTPLAGWMPPLPELVHWNYDVVTRAPEGTEVWAQTPDGAIQACQYRPAMWGIQGHPEAGSAIVKNWASDESSVARLTERGVDVATVVQRVDAADRALAVNGATFAAAFISICRQAHGS